MEFFEGLHLDGWFGKPEVWMVIAGVWVIAMVIVALLFDIIMHVGSGE